MLGHAPRRARAASMPGTQRAQRFGDDVARRSCAGRGSRTDPGRRSACPRAAARSSSPSRSWMARPSHTISPPVDGPEPQQRARERGFAAAGFADDAQAPRPRPRRTTRRRRRASMRAGAATRAQAGDARARRAPTAAACRRLDCARVFPRRGRRRAASRPAGSACIRAPARRGCARPGRVRRCGRARMTATSSASAAMTPMSCVTTASAMSRSVTSWRSSARICACTVTSSAVVGSSAISSFGSQASAMAIMARWRMPPDNSCGYWRRRRGTSVMRTCSSSSAARARASLPAHAAMRDQRLGDLVADAQVRRERGHRILEDHRDAAAAQRRGARAEQIEAFEARAAR